MVAVSDNDARRFDYGNAGDTSNDGPFVQLISTTDLRKAVPEFAKARNQALAELPPAVDTRALLDEINKELEVWDNGTDSGDDAAAVSTDDGKKSTTDTKKPASG